LPGDVLPEREVVADGVSLFSEVSHFIVDVEEDCLVVYVPTMSDDKLDSLVRHLAGPDALEIPRYREARDRFVRELLWTGGVRVTPTVTATGFTWEVPLR
jgi:hypothetical protein